MGLCWQPLCLHAQRAHSSTKGQPACWWARAVYSDVARGREKQASKQGSAWPIKAPLIPFQLSILFPKCMPPSLCLLFYRFWAAIPTDWNTSDTPLKEIPEYTTETVTRCRPQCPLGEMLCGESNVITRPYTTPTFPFDLSVYLWLIGIKANWVLSIWLWNRSGSPIGILWSQIHYALFIALSNIPTCISKTKALLYSFKRSTGVCCRTGSPLIFLKREK